MHHPTINSIAEIIYEEKMNLKREIDRLQSLGSTGRYRAPKYLNVGKSMFPIRTVIDMENEAMACLDVIEAAIRGLGASPEKIGTKKAT